MMFVCWSKTYINIRSWSTCNSHWINLFICINLSAYRSLRWDINTTAIYRKPLRVKFNVFNDGRLSSWIIGSSNNIEVVAIDSFEFVPLNCTQGHSLNRSSSLCRRRYSYKLNTVSRKCLLKTINRIVTRYEQSYNTQKSNKKILSHMIVVFCIFWNE